MLGKQNQTEGVKAALKVSSWPWTCTCGMACGSVLRTLPLLPHLPCNIDTYGPFVIAIHMTEWIPTTQ